MPNNQGHWPYVIQSMVIYKGLSIFDNIVGYLALYLKSDRIRINVFPIKQKTRILDENIYRCRNKQAIEWGAYRRI
jgi:hypothetical protein